MTRRNTGSRRPRKDERGAEAVAMLFVIPFLVILIFALIDVGFSIRTRMMVENVARDAARGAAADGGYRNPVSADGSILALENGWQTRAMKSLWSEDRCTFSGCEKRPEVTCWPRIATAAGDEVGCRVTYYPTAINKALLNGPLGLGMGALVPEKIEVTSFARAETGSNPWG